MSHSHRTSPTKSTLAPPQLSQSTSPGPNAMIDPTLFSYRPPSPSLEPIRKPGFEYYPQLDPRRRSTSPHKPQASAVASTAEQPSTASPTSLASKTTGVAENDDEWLKRPLDRTPMPVSSDLDADNYVEAAETAFAALLSPEEEELVDPDLVGAQVRRSSQAADYDESGSEADGGASDDDDDREPERIKGNGWSGQLETLNQRYGFKNSWDENDDELAGLAEARGTSRDWDRDGDVLDLNSTTFTATSPVHNPSSSAASPIGSAQSGDDAATANPSLPSNPTPSRYQTSHKRVEQPSTRSEEEALLKIALEQSQQEQDERDVQAAIAQSLGLPLPTYGDPEPKPKEFNFDASSLMRPTSEMMLNVQLETAYYSRELEIFREKWLVELCVKLQSQAQRKAPIGNVGGVTYKFGPRGTVVAHHPADADKMDDDSEPEPETPAFGTLTADAQVLITYQALNDLIKSGVDCPAGTKQQLLESRKLASNVLYTLTREFGPVLQYEPVDDDAEREFAIVADAKSTDPDEQFDKDVGLWLRTMGEKDVLFKRAAEVMAKKRKLDDSRYFASLPDEMDPEEMAHELCDLKERFDHALSAQALAESLVVEQSNRATEAETKLARLANEREQTIKRLQDVVSGGADAGVALADLLRDLSLASAVDEVEAEAAGYESELDADELNADVDGKELQVETDGDRWSDSDDDMWSTSAGV